MNLEHLLSDSDACKLDKGLALGDHRMTAETKHLLECRHGDKNVAYAKCDGDDGVKYYDKHNAEQETEAATCLDGGDPDAVPDAVSVELTDPLRQHIAMKEVKDTKGMFFEVVCKNDDKVLTPMIRAMLESGDTEYTTLIMRVGILLMRHL